MLGNSHFILNTHYDPLLFASILSNKRLPAADVSVGGLRSVASEPAAAFAAFAAAAEVPASCSPETQHLFAQTANR